jgi:hypothetical protein
MEWHLLFQSLLVSIALSGLYALWSALRYAYRVLLARYTISLTLDNNVHREEWETFMHWLQAHATPGTVRHVQPVVYSIHRHAVEPAQTPERLVARFGDVTLHVTLTQEDSQHQINVSTQNGGTYGTNERPRRA